MIVSFEGPMGEGKTLTAVTLAYLEHAINKKRVISNNHLQFPYQYFDLGFFLEHITDHELESCVLLLDESYLYLDSRTSASKMNRLFVYFTAQTRKRGVDMYICTHHIDAVDKRLRRAIDIRGTCRMAKEDPCSKCKGAKVYKDDICPRCLGYGVTGWAQTTFFNRRTGDRPSPIIIFGPRYWGLYDTTELVPMSKGQTNVSLDSL